MVPKLREAVNGKDRGQGGVADPFAPAPPGTALSDGGAAWLLPLLAQRAASEEWDGQPGRPPARGTRTIGMCSFDARSYGANQTTLGGSVEELTSLDP